jgi:putative ABC transport system ATP-binding protein
MSHAPVLIANTIIKDLGQGAGTVRALKGVSLELRPGELTLLMGPSGSGKTTLLSILGCILAPTDGTLTVAGQSTLDLSAEALADLRRKHVGFIFQSYNLFPTLNAIENVRLALDVRGDRGPDATARALQALKDVGLSHRLNSYPATMSGGEQQRVAVARAIAGNPSVILADEPTAALDSDNGKAVMELLSKVAHDAHHAVLAVTHDPRTMSYADRILQIEDGRIVGDKGPPEGGGAINLNTRSKKRKSDAKP